MGSRRYYHGKWDFEAPSIQFSNMLQLSDGICDSSCALFMEMMHHEAGVRVVAAGGRPTAGPMQAPSGSRGAVDYPTDILDANIDFTQQILELEGSTEVNFLPNRTEQLTMFVTYADINLRDQVRRNETIPLQFAYEAADCRIFYTPQTIYNYTALWQYAADAIWTKPSLCVANSTGYATTGTNTTDFVGPAPGTPGVITNTTNHLTALNISSVSYLLALNDGLQDGGFNLPRGRNLISSTCSVASPCAAGSICSGGKCLLECIVGSARCQGGSPCQARSSTGEMVGSQNLLKGVCPATNSKSSIGKTSPGPLTTE
jgi:hypothetical protein